MRAFDRWRRLSETEKALVLTAAPVVASAAARVHLLGVKHALAWATSPVRARAHGSPDGLVQACERAARYLPGATCLARSAALARLLRKRGVPANVRIGVETDPAFAAHAWVEVNGVPLGESPTRYTPLPVL